MRSEAYEQTRNPGRFRRSREIGPWGTTTRALAGVALIGWAVAVPHEHPWLDLPGAGSRPLGSLVGAVIVPTALTLAVLLRGRAKPALRLGAGSALAVTGGWLVLMQIYPVAMLVAVGVPLVVLAAAGRCGCELMAIPNLILRRNDYLFCLPFSPIDAWEGRGGTR
ncbi:MAG: hypothetical protein ACRDPS_14940 [Nocardioides sp.]|uniref:hypothetical protein n=1 Tax=Nocardioides sp. TaxID=35761 RepID=UPI003D6C4E5A